MAWEKFLAAAFLLGVQYGGMMTQIRNDYAKGEQTYPVRVQKAQALLTAWEGGKAPLHGSNKGIRFSNAVNNNDGNRGAVNGGDTHTSGGRASRGGATKIRR